jgi:hypothetical protein
MNMVRTFGTEEPKNRQFTGIEGVRIYDEMSV